MALGFLHAGIELAVGEGAGPPSPNWALEAGLNGRRPSKSQRCRRCAASLACRAPAKAAGSPVGPKTRRRNNRKAQHPPPRAGAWGQWRRPLALESTGAPRDQAWPSPANRGAACPAPRLHQPPAHPRCTPAQWRPVARIDAAAKQLQLTKASSGSFKRLATALGNASGG